MSVTHTYYLDGYEAWISPVVIQLVLQAVKSQSACLQISLCAALAKQQTVSVPSFEPLSRQPRSVHT